VRRIVGSLEAIPHQRRVRRIALDWGADVVHATHSTMAPARWRALIVNAWDPEPGAVARMRLARERGLRPWPEGIFAVNDAIAQRRAAGPRRRDRDRPRLAREEIRPGRLVAAVRLRRGDHAGSAERPATCVMVANYFDGPRKNVDLAIGRSAAFAPVTRMYG